MDEIIHEIEEARKRGYGKYITVGGIRIRYMVEGSGPSTDFGEAYYVG
jgi:hypothetical protein